MLGQVAVTAGIDFGAASFLGAYLNLQFGFEVTPGRTILLFAGILVLHGLLNTFGVRIVGLLNSISVWWHVLGVAVIVGALTFVPDHHQSASFVFTRVREQHGLGQRRLRRAARPADGAVHLHRVRRLRPHDGGDARRVDGRARRASCGRSGRRGSPGFVLLLGFTFAIQSYDGALGSPTGAPPAQILLDALGATAGKLLLLVVIGAQLFCGMASVTANSRMIYAFSRDGALPFSRVWHTVSPRTRTPVAAVWLAAAGRAGPRPAVPDQRHGVRGGDVDRGDRPVHRVRHPDPAAAAQGRRASSAGPWHLGRWSRPVGMVAVAWVGVITVLFMLPQVSPVTWETFNYAPIAVLAVLGFAATWWLASARHWFLNPDHERTTPERRPARGPRTRSIRDTARRAAHDPPASAGPCRAPPTHPTWP